MRVCVVCHEASLTGAPRIGFDIAAFLAGRHDTTLVVKKGGPLIDLPAYAPLRGSYRCLESERQTSGLGYRERVERAVALVRELAPDVLYVNSVAAGEWCEAGALAGVPVALHTHETRDSLPGLLSSVCTPRVLRWTNLLVGASRRAIDDIQTLTSTSVADRFMFGIFIDTENVLAQSMLDVPAPTNAKGEALEDGGVRRLVGMCGLAQPRKGADIFLDVAVRLPAHDFVWIGPWAPSDADTNDGTYRRFQDLALPNFYVTGLAENPYAYLRCLDTFVLTSREDPNPLVVAEALVLGKKVVAFSETGASAGLLARFGYAFTGRPDAVRIAKVLPGILADGNRAWRSDLAERVRAQVDGAERLTRLEETLERLVLGMANESSVPA